MKKNHSLRDYFTFSRKERLALLVLLLVTGTLFLLPSFFPGSGKVRYSTADSSWIREMARRTVPSGDSFQRTGKKLTVAEPESQAGPPAVLFPFDPNTVSGEEWSRLGLRDRTIRTILRFREKGGIFRKPEDLGRIYGLHPEEFNRLQPWIRLESPFKPTGSTSPETFSNRPSFPTYKKKEYRQVDINDADSADWVLLPGIGARLAARIVSFREKLGGFYNPDQVAETWGLPDSVFINIRPYLSLGNRSHRKLNLNAVAEAELKAHPYFRWQILKPLLAYRAEHGPFGRVEDIRKIQAISDSVYRKISPYLLVE